MPVKRPYLLVTVVEGVGHDVLLRNISRMSPIFVQVLEESQGPSDKRKTARDGASIASSFTFTSSMQAGRASSLEQRARAVACMKKQETIPDGLTDQ